MPDDQNRGVEEPEVYVLRDGRLVREQAPSHSEALRNEWWRIQRRQVMQALYGQQMMALMTAFPSGPHTTWLILVDAPDDHVYFCFPDRTGDLSDRDFGHISEFTKVPSESWRISSEPSALAAAAHSGGGPAIALPGSKSGFPPGSTLPKETLIPHRPFPEQACAVPTM